MITRPITTPSFQARVLSALDSYFETVSKSANADDVPYPLIPPLTPEDTTLLPDEFITTMLLVSSPWIDLASSDPAVAHVSRQVFNHEIAYAAFCGVNNIIVQGPRLEGNGSVAQYARSIMQALNLGAYLNLQIMMPMTGTEVKDVSQSPRHVASRARNLTDSVAAASNNSDTLCSWDAWELIRTLCSFNSRLSVGKSCSSFLSIFFSYFLCYLIGKT